MVKVLQYAFLNYLLTMWYDSESSCSSHMHLVSTIIAFSLEFLRLLGRRFCGCFGRFIWKRVVGFPFHTCILYCWLWGFGGDWLTCGFGGIQKLWFFWGLSLCQCLGHHNTRTCFQDIPSTLLVHALFHSFWGGVEMFVYTMTKKLLDIV